MSFQSVRFWRWHPKTYVFESNDNARSENALAGLYDCYFAGPDGYGGAAVTGVSSNAGAAGTATFNRFDGKTWSSAGYGPGTVVQALGFNAPTNERWTVSSVSGTTMTVTDPTDAIVTQGQSSSRSIHKAFNHECKQNIRCGYLSFDIIDCRFCSSSEHGAYHSGPRQDGQLIRTENVASSSLWPEHPSPDTVSGGVRGGRTFNQVVGRASYCAAGGHGPPAQGTWLVEDITARNYSVGNNVGTLTYVGILSDVIIRRANFIGGKGLILFWVDMGVSQSTPPASKGHHHSLGQFSGVQWTNSCSIGGGNKGAVSGAVPAPDSLPASSIAHAQGNVVIEGITGSGATTDIPIRTGGCESVTIRNCLGLLGASSKTPYIHASYWARPTTKWVWFGYGGPYRDKDFRFEVPPGETVSSYYGTATGASLSDLMAYASPSNVNNNTGGAGTGVNDARLTGDQIDSLVPGGAEWPLFAQNMDYGNPLPNSMNGKSIGGIFPSMTAPEDYGPWKDAIYDPGYNTHTPHRLEHTTGSATWGDASGVFLSSLEPVEIQIESKRGDIQFPLGLVAASPVQIEIESKRGFLASPVQLLGDSVTLEIDPPDASHILVPMGGGVSTVEIASKRGHLSFGGVSPIEMTGDPSEMLVMPAAGYIKFAPEMVSDGTIQIEIAPGGGVFGPMLLAGSVLVEVSLQSMFSNTAAPLTAGGWSGNSSKVREEFRTRVAVPYSLTVQFDNEATQAIGNQRWARAQVIHASTSRLRQNSIRTTRAGGMVRRGGLLLVQIFAPITEGDGDLLAIADFVEDSMRSTTLDGVTYHVPSTERVGRTQDGKWWQVNVQVPFSFVMEI